MGKEEFVRVRGVIVAAEWDIADRVIRVAIRTPSEEEYLVAPYGKGLDLLDRLEEKVEAEGTLRKDWDGSIIIQIRRFRLPSEEEGDEPFVNRNQVSV